MSMGEVGPGPSAKLTDWWGGIDSAQDFPMERRPEGGVGLEHLGTEASCWGDQRARSWGVLGDRPELSPGFSEPVFS